MLPSKANALGRFETSPKKKDLEGVRALLSIPSRAGGFRCCAPAKGNVVRRLHNGWRRPPTYQRGPMKGSPNSTNLPLRGFEVLT